MKLVWYVRLGSLCLLNLFCCGVSLGSSLTRWSGPEVTVTGWVDTGRGFLSWLWCGVSGTNDWGYTYALSQYVYMPVDYQRAGGGWVYLSDMGKVQATPIAGMENGWFTLNELESHAYIPTAQSAGGSWVYLVNTGNNLPIKANPLIILPQHAADHDKEDPEERFANAIRLSADYIERFVDTDSDIYVTRTAAGVNFMNPLLFPGGNANRMIRIGFDEGSGYFDFSSLDGISGEGRIVIRADVDLSQTTNGFYARVLREGVDVAAYERLAAGIIEEDILLEPYLTIGRDATYAELTLPWQSEITIKEMYLYMDTQVRGFADMEQRITGGEGAAERDIYRVENAAEFADAVEVIQLAGRPSVIEVAGTIHYDDWIAAGQSGREASIGSGMENITIIGIGTEALFDGVGIVVQGKNIIIQNVTMRYVLGRDAIQINNGSYVKIDHCTLYNESFDINGDSDKFDELISIKNNASHVIVSWNEIYYSHKTILVGSNDEVDALPDRKVIFHHNWFHDNNFRHPLYRGGHAHVYNNYYERVHHAIDVRANAKVLIENNYFEQVRTPIDYYPDGYSGGMEVNGNYSTGSGTLLTGSTMDIQFSGDYRYTLDPVESVPDIVRAGAGVGKLD